MGKSIKIISGGQTGVDRGALDFALENGMECGGWCPPDRRCENGRIPDKYPLIEVELPDYNERTRRNIRDSDATLLITAGGRLEEGTRLTLEWAGKLGRPVYHLDLADLSMKDTEQIKEADSWLRAVNPGVLNLAGNRESTSPGIQEFTRGILGFLFR
jgi:hypothetical protein